jgi:hypothetical protein
MNKFQKTPGESYQVSVDMTGLLPDSATISSGAVTASVLRTGEDKTSTVLASGTATITGGVVAKVGVQSGDAGVDYLIKFALTLSNGNIVEEFLTMSVAHFL